MMSIMKTWLTYHFSRREERHGSGCYALMLHTGDEKKRR